jgi:DNA-binding XRE family transcriptional regulator
MGDIYRGEFQRGSGILPNDILSAVYRNCEPVALRKAFGVTVRMLRKRAGFSQESFALQSGIDRGYMGGLERGSHSATLGKICQVVTALGVSYSDFFAEFEKHLHPHSRRKPPLGPGAGK